MFKARFVYKTDRQAFYKYFCQCLKLSQRRDWPLISSDTGLYISIYVGNIVRTFQIGTDINTTILTKVMQHRNPL